MSTPPDESEKESPKTEQSDQSDRLQVWTLVFEVVGATAGFVVVLYLIGGGVMAARLKALDLPVDSTVALIPTGTLIVAALKMLAVGLLAGGAMIAVLEFDRRSGETPLGVKAWRRVRTLPRSGTQPAAPDPSGETSPVPETTEAPRAGTSTLLAKVKARISRMRPRSEQRLEIIMASSIVVVAVLYQVLLTPMNWFWRLGILAGGVAAVALVVWVLEHLDSWRQRAYALFGLIAVLAGGLHAVSEFLPPTRLDYMSLRMKNGHLLEGYHLGQSKEAVIIAPNVYNRTIQMVSVVPRSEIEHASISVEPTHAQALGGDIPKSLVSTGLPTPRLTPQAEAERDEVLEYLAGIRTDPGWRYPPRVPWDSALYLIEHFEDFEDRPREFTLAGTFVELDDLLVDPQMYIGEPVRTRGDVIRAHVTDQTDEAVSQIVVIGTEDAAGEAYCLVTTPGTGRFTAGDRVEFVAAVTAWGTWISRAGDEIEELALTCSAARDSPLIEAAE